MMFLNSVFMLNYPLGLTLIQSSLKALKGGVIEGFNTHTQTNTHTHTHIEPHECIPAQQKEGALLEFQQLRNQFVENIPASLFKDRPVNRFSPNRCPCFSGEKVTRMPLCMKIWIFFFWSHKSVTSTAFFLSS